MPDMAIKRKRWKAGSRSGGCKSRENRIESESCCLYQAIAFFIVTIFVTNFVTFKRNVMNKDGTKRRVKNPEKSVNTRKNALDKT